MKMKLCFFIFVLLILPAEYANSQSWNLLNAPPTIDKIDDYGPIPENSPTQEIELTGISSGKGELEQKVTISATSDNPTLISEIKISYTQGESIALLFFSLVNNANGKAKISVRLNDGQLFRNITEVEFDVEVFPVNGKPIFSLSVNTIIVDENSGKTLLNKFVYAIDDGDPELKQKLDFIVELEDIQGNLSFKTNPAISSEDGSIEFEANRNTYGEAVFSLVLHDNGGTKNGGIDKSNRSVFTIRVIHPNEPPTLDDINPISILEDGGLQSVLLTGISPGINENQVITITATSSNTTLLSTISIDFIQGQNTATLKFSPIKDKFGNSTITVIIDDHQNEKNTITKQFDVKVDPVADNPSITNASTRVGSQTLSGLVISRNPVDGAEVTYFKITEIKSGTLYQNDGVSIINNNSFITAQQGFDGLKFTPSYGISENGSFKIQAATGPNDLKLGGGEIKAEIAIQNNPPDIISTPDSIAEITKAYKYEISATDPDLKDILKFTISIPETIKTWLNYIDHKDGTASLLGTAPSGSEGIYAIEVKVEDQFGANDTQLFSLTVRKPNKRPELLPISKNTMEDNSILFTKNDFGSKFLDADKDSLIFFKMMIEPQFGVVKVNGELLQINTIVTADNLKSLEYIPLENYYGLDIFDWNASDGKEFALTPQRVSIHISSVNDPPEIINFEDNPFIYEFGDHSIQLTDSANVVDVDGDKIVKASIEISTNYHRYEDSLFYKPISDITFYWNDTTGVLSLTGIAKPVIYQEAIRSIKYVNLNNLTPSKMNRDVEIILYDGDTSSLVYERKILFRNTFVEIDIPNGFTPNNDGINDTWDISNLNGYDDLKVMVFSRSGQMIFETDSYFEQWDGNYDGKLVSPGVYYYLIKIQKFEKVYRGTLTVLR